MVGLRHDGATYRGALWTLTNAVWSSVFVRLEQSTLFVFPDEKTEKAGAEPQHALSLQGGQVQTVPGGGPKALDMLDVTGFEASQRSGDGQSASAPSKQRLVFAAEDASTHAAWQRHMARAAGCSMPEAASGNAVSASQQRKRARATSLFGPSPLVFMRLCCAGREFGKQLLQRLKHARRAFEEGLRDLTVVSDKARLAQRGLYDVDSLLLTISRALADSHPSLEEQSEADAEALVWCRDWVSGLQAFIMNLDHQADTMLQREAAPQLPGNWCTFAQNSVMQLRDIEDAMQAGQTQWRTQQAPAVPDALRQRRCTTPRARMPYSAHWARATAI